MKIIKPDSFRGPRTYFTDFDHRIIDRINDLSWLRLQVERKLKRLLLIKAKVVCAASHLTTEFVYDMFKENPKLLNQGHIIPALRSDIDSFAEIHNIKDFRRKNEIVDFYQNNINHVVTWEMDDISKWFSDKFIEQLISPNSLLRNNLINTSSKSLYQSSLDRLLNEISKKGIINRQHIEQFANDFHQKQRSLVLYYREILYNLSGARIVNCEISLPQSICIDHDIVDTAQKTERLDDQFIFNLFIELVFETLQRRMISCEILDLLSFDDILSIRIPILNSGFQNKYNQIVSKARLCIQKGYSDRFVNLKEIEEIKCSLKKTINNVFKDEGSYFLKKQSFKQKKSLYDLVLSIALGVLGFIPVVGALASGVSVAKNLPALLLNVSQARSSNQSFTNLNLFIERKELLLKEKISKSHISDQSTILDMIDLLTKLLAEKLKIS